MSIVLKETSELGRELVCRVEHEVVNRVRQEIIAELKRDARIPGFRKGRVPEPILAQRYAEEIREQILNRLIPDLYASAVKEHGLSPVVDPEVRDVSIDENGLSCTIYTELKPAVEIGKYTGLTVKKVQPAAVTDEQVDAVLADWERRPEFAASIIDPEKRRAWRSRIREQMERMAVTEARAAEDNQIWEQLFSAARFPVPEKLVAEQARRYAREELRRMDLRDASEEEAEKIARDLLEKFRPVAEREVRKHFILDYVASAEHLAATEEEVEERVVRLARLSGEPQDEVRKKLEDSGRLDDIREDIRIEKAFSFIKNSAQVIERVILPGEDARRSISGGGRESRGGA